MASAGNFGVTISRSTATSRASWRTTTSRIPRKDRHEDRDTPRLRDRDRSLFVWEHIRHPLDKVGDPRRAVLGVPSVLHGQAEARGHRRPRGAVPAPVRPAPDCRLGRLVPAVPGGAVDEGHFYGGQAVLEGVLMRGRDHWAVAVRRPDQTVHLESHEIRSIGNRLKFLAKPGLRGVLALGQALSIGVRALTISANQSVEEEEKLTSKQMGASMVLAFVVFAAVFVVGPFVGFRFLRRAVTSNVYRNLLEGVFRVGLFLAYLAVIGRMKEIRRVFEYHGAEHKTIAAYEHDDPLEPEVVDRYSTLHVRCV